MAPVTDHTILLAYGLAVAVAALGFNLLLGYSGLLSFGHSAYVGVGAYAVAFLVKYFKIDSMELHLAGGILATAAPLHAHLLRHAHEAAGPESERWPEEGGREPRHRGGPEDQGQGIAILIAESSLPNAARAVGRLYAIDRGEIIFEGDPTRAFQNADPMKTIRGQRRCRTAGPRHKGHQIQGRAPRQSCAVRCTPHRARPTPFRPTPCASCASCG